MSVVTGHTPWPFPGSYIQKGCWWGELFHFSCLKNTSTRGRHKVSHFTSFSLSVYILQLCIFSCPCWNRVAFSFVHMKLCPCFLSPRNREKLRALQVIWRVLLTHRMEFQGLRAPLLLCYRIHYSLGLTLQSWHMISRPLFCGCKDIATAFDLEKFTLTLLFCDSDLKGKKGLNRRHSVILEMLFYDWRSEWVPSVLGAAEQKQVLLKMIVRKQQRKWNKSVFLFWSYLMVCSNYKTISNFLVLWIKLELPRNYKNPLSFQICSTTCLLFSLI